MMYIKYQNVKAAISKIAGCILFVLFFLPACMEEVTLYNMTDEKLVNILADIHISEAAIQHLSLSIKDSMADLYLEQILMIHETSKDVFEPEYQRLKNDPKKLEDIYAKIITRLNELKLKKREKNEEDSNDEKIPSPKS